jgi:hypothetical protein
MCEVAQVSPLSDQQKNEVIAAHPILPLLVIAVANLVTPLATQRHCDIHKGS